MNEAATSRDEEQRSTPESPVRIGIVGHVGNKNLGDEAIITAVIQNIRRRFPTAEIYGFTLKPDDTAERHGIPSFPIERPTPRVSSSTSSAGAPSSSPESDSPGQSLREAIKRPLRRMPPVYSALRGVAEAARTVPAIVKEPGFLLECRKRLTGLDLLIFAGSHQLNDYVGGPWYFAYNVLKWTVLARATGARVVFMSMGAGPIETHLGRLFIRQALRLADYRSYRDRTAQRVVESLGFEEPGEVVPDLAFSLAFPDDIGPRTPRPAPVVGLNVLPLYADYWYRTESGLYQDYVRKLAAFADWLVDRGCEVRFIPTQLRVDPAVAGDVKGLMKTVSVPETERRVVECRIDSLDDLLSELAAVDFMVATRYHGVVLSLALNKPVLAIGYHVKSRDLMNWVGLGDYFVDSDTFEVKDVKERFRLLQANAPTIANSLRRQVPEFQRSLQLQYDDVFQILGGAATISA